MRLEKLLFLQATETVGIEGDTAERLWEELSYRTQARFNLDKIVVYLAALKVVGAMGWVLNKGWDLAGGLALTSLGFVYLVALVLAGRYLWFRKGMRVPGGLAFTGAVWMVPLVLFGAQQTWGWPAPGFLAGVSLPGQTSWILLEVATLLAGALVLRFIRFSFLVFPVAVAFWFLCLDLAPLLFGEYYGAWQQQPLLSVAAGSMILAVTMFFDGKTKVDYAFWGYFFGLLAFWGGLSVMETDNEIIKLGYCGLNLGLMWVSVQLRRRVFMVFGTLGVGVFLSYLAVRLLAGSFLLPVVLALIGLALLTLGVYYQRHPHRVYRHFFRLLRRRLRTSVY